MNQQQYTFIFAIFIMIMDSHTFIHKNRLSMCFARLSDCDRGQSS